MACALLALGDVGLACVVACLALVVSRGLSPALALGLGRALALLGLAPALGFACALAPAFALALALDPALSRGCLPAPALGRVRAPGHALPAISCFARGDAHGTAPPLAHVLALALDLALALALEL